MTTTRIQCQCKVCKSNAATLGLATPLVADVPEHLAVMIGKTAAGRHGLVHMAYDPNAITGEAARIRTGVRPVQS